MAGFGTNFIVDEVLDITKSYVDIVEIRSRWDDDHLLNREIASALRDVIHRIMNWASDSIILTFDFTITSASKHYEMPPNIKSVTRIMSLDLNGEEVSEYLPRPANSFRGFGWRIEGNQLVLSDTPTIDESLRIWYLSNGDVGLHRGTGTLNADNTFTLAEVPSLGTLDLRPSAYAGQMFRIKTSPTIGATGREPIYERIINTHTEASSVWTISLRNSLPSTVATAADYDYEIVPWGDASLWECIAVRAALRLATKLSMTMKDRKALQQEYNSTLKTAMETHEFMQGRRPPHMSTESIEGDNYSILPKK